MVGENLSECAGDFCLVGQKVMLAKFFFVECGSPAKVSLKTLFLVFRPDKTETKKSHNENGDRPIPSQAQKNNHGLASNNNRHTNQRENPE